MKANSSLSILTNLGKSTWGVSLQERRNVYQATILPHILYYSLVWANTRNTMAAKALTTIQAQAARYISGAYKRTSGEALDEELYLEPTTLKLKQEAHKALIRINSTPQGRELLARNAPKDPLTAHKTDFEAIYSTQLSSLAIKTGFITPPWAATLNIQ